MGKNLLKKGGVAGVVILWLAAAVKADSTISYTNSVSGSTDWSKQLSLPQFNPDLGTLESITLDLSASFSSTFTITNTGNSTYGAGSTAQKNLNIFIGSSAVDQAIDADNPNDPGNAWLFLLSNALNIGNLAPGAYKNTSSARTGSAGPSEGPLH
jgi:hypothetical protein